MLDKTPAYCRKRIMNYSVRILSFTVFCFMLSFCTNNNTVTFDNISVKYEDMYVFENNDTNKSFGGISGIEYNSASCQFYLLSDDRSKVAPARYYCSSIQLNKTKIETVIVDSTVFLTDNYGAEFADDEVDFESIRFNPLKNIFVIGDEGGKKGRPGIRFFNRKGKYLKSMLLDSTYINNIRGNKAFEGISLTQDKSGIFYTTEEPLKRDGGLSGFESQGLLRIIKQNIETNKISLQADYYLEKLPQDSIATPPWGGHGVDNGLTELLFLNDTLFLSLERSGAFKSQREYIFVCKLFICKIDAHTSASNDEHPGVIKKEIFDFSSLPYQVLNVEGMTLGGKVNGKQKLFLVSDNNFTSQPTIIYLFTITI